MDTATSKSLGVDTAMSKSPGVDTAMARREYSDASFLLHRILHQKVINVENLRGKIRAFVLVYCILLYPDVPIRRVINIIKSCKVIDVNPLL